jgi:hypothetical protein
LYEWERFKHLEIMSFLKLDRSVKLFLGLSLIFSLRCYAREHPVNGGTYTAIRLPLSIDSVRGTATYVFRIASGNCKSPEEMQRQALHTVRCGAPVTIADLPYFDREYSWDVTCYDIKGKIARTSPIYHFRTEAPLYGDSTRYRLRVISNKYTDTSLYFFVDNMGCLYNMRGKPVWFSRQIASNKDKGQASNLSMSADHTITFILNEVAYETNYNSEVLWRSPELSDTRKANSSHHEFYKRPNSNYLVLDWETEQRKVPIAAEGNAPAETVEVSFGTVDEYDRNGKLVWHWSSSACFADDDLIDIRNGTQRSRGRTHMNACYFDEEESVMYVGFKDVSRIVKLKYPDKKILATYYGLGEVEQPLFIEQHSISTMEDKSLLIFSNNISASTAMPNVLVNHIDKDSAVSSVVVLSRPDTNGKMKKLWEFPCDIDKEVPASATRGGNVVELADGNFFVCMGNSPRIFIVNRKKEVLFNAVVEEWSEAERKWMPFFQYRSYPINAKDLDRVITNSCAR